MPCASPLLPFYCLDYLGRQLLNQSFLVYVFISFHPNLPRFLHRVNNPCSVSCPSSPLLRPPRPRPRSRPRCYPRSPSPLLLWFPSPLPSTFPSLVRPRVSTPVPVPVPAPSPLPFPLPSCVARSLLHSHPLLRSRLRPGSLLPVSWTRLPSRYDARVQTLGLANGAGGCPQVPPPVCRGDDACGITAHRVYNSCVVSYASLRARGGVCVH